jgi:hypothetical protein
MAFSLYTKHHMHITYNAREARLTAAATNGKMTALGSPKTKKANGGVSFWDKVALPTSDRTVTG